MSNLSSQLSIKPWHFTRALLLVIVVLVCLHLLGWRYTLQHDGAVLWLGQFDLDGEGNVPTIFSVLILFISSVLLFLQGRLAANNSNGFVRHWYLLAMIFVFLAVDEGAEIHEEVGPLMDALLESYGLEATSYFFYAWILPYALVVMLLFFSYLKFMFSLPHRIAGGLIVAAIFYLGGAVGLEMVSANVAWQSGDEAFVYRVYSTLEESCEMLGIVILIHTLMRYFQLTYGEMRLRIT